jgi:Ser/Thr protein kinase RdoA (MazF antagonist)
MGRLSDRLDGALGRLHGLRRFLRTGADAPHVGSESREAGVEEALGRWGARGSSVTPLSVARNRVYKFDRGETPYVLRLIDGARREADVVEAELDWLRYLHAHGVPVAIPVLSEQGRLVEPVAGPHGRTWNAVVFPFIEGRPPEFVASGALEGPRIRSAGEILGRIHRLTASFSPQDGRRRFRWSDVDLPAMAARYVPKSHWPLVERIDETWQWLKTLPETAEAGFGLIHGDYHSMNLLEARNGIHVIDFDAAQYSWKQVDLAHMMAMTLRPFAEQPVEARAQRAREMFQALVQGYSMEHRFEQDWVLDLPRFMHLADLRYCLILCIQVRLAAPDLSVTRVPNFAATYANVKDGHEAMRMDLLPAYRNALSSPP